MTGWGKLALALTLGTAVLGACGSDEGLGSSSDASAGVGGTAGTGASGGASGGSGGGAGTDAGGASDANDGDVGDVEASDGDAAVEGCADAHVVQSSLPPDVAWSNLGLTLGLYADRDHIWRDAVGVHIAWNPEHAGGGGELAVSTYDVNSGKLVGHRFFRNGPALGMYATAQAPDGTVGIAVKAHQDGGAYPALLLIRTDDPSYEKLYPLSPWPGAGTDLVGVGWDGEAFAVHGFADDGTVYVTRIAEDGTVLLGPQAFGIATGYASDSRFSTDPTSGMTYGLMGGKTLVAHQRDGTPVPDPPAVVPTPVQSAPGGQWSTLSGSCTGSGCALVALPNGVATAFSGDDPTGDSTLIQTLYATLASDADTIFVKGELVPNPFDAKIYDWNRELVIQASSGGWWLAGNPNYRSIDEYMVSNAQLTSRRTLVTFSDQALSTGFGFDSRHFESVAWNGELWLGFEDNSNTDPTAEHPYRIIRVKPGCTYRSMTDIEHGW
jgi:hypothetical protein